MRKIGVDSLKAGQVFSQPVYIEGNNILVPAGSPIRDKDLAKLKTWGITLVQTEGSVVAEAQAAPAATAPMARNATAQSGTGGDEARREPVSGILSLPEVQENKAVYREYTDLIERLNEAFDQISAGVSSEARILDAIVARLLQGVREHRDNYIGFILGGEVSGNALAKSSVNAAILSMMIAMEMRLPNHRILQIATGALLHDVGMLRLPAEILRKDSKLSDGELQRVQAHPLYAFKIISKDLLYPESVGIVALQHHERWDGEGYPRRVAGDEIDIGARIVSVADAFEAMVSEKPYRSPIIGYQAMKNLLSDNSRRFDPDVLKAFIRTMGIYPIGSIVLLNNGAVARVSEVHGDAPLRPVVRVLIDEFGHAFGQDEGEALDLLTEKSIFIARAIDPKEFTGGE